MMELAFVLVLSACSSCLFFRCSPKTMLAAFAAAAVCGVVPAFLLRQGLLQVWFALFGVLAGAVAAVLTEKRPFGDLLLFFSVGGCFWSLWSGWKAGFSELCGDEVLLFLLGLFYLLHIPAVLLSCPGYAIPGNWRTEPVGEDRKTRFAVCAIPAAMLLLSLLLSAMPAELLWQKLTKWLLLTAIFWGGTSIPVLLTAYGSRSVQSSEENDYYRSMRSFINVVRSQRHDYNLHVQTVAGLIQQEKWQECRDYVQSLELDTAEMNAVLPVEDPAVAALIHNYHMQARQRGIEMVMDIRDDLSLVVTNAYETNKIIGNLLQNALDELEQQGKAGTIELGIFKRGEYCLIRVSNRVADSAAFAAVLKELFDQGFTTKQGHDGVGLSSIQTLARRVGGDVTAWLEGDIVHFVASVPMRLKPN